MVYNLIEFELVIRLVTFIDSNFQIIKYFDNLVGFE
jgi:hypothetical protein